MNDLKEIGGFIVSADPYVNHDNSLSGNGTLTSPLGITHEWINVRDEVNYNTNVIAAGGFRIYYNKTLKLVSLTCDVQLKAGSVSDRIMTWTDRLTPVDTVQFALGNGLSVYVSSATLNQPAAASQRWINGVWMWPVKGE